MRGKEWMPWLRKASGFKNWKIVEVLSKEGSCTATGIDFCNSAWRTGNFTTFSRAGNMKPLQIARKNSELTFEWARITQSTSRGNFTFNSKCGIMHNLYPGWKIVLPALRVRNMKPLRTLGNYAISAQGGRACNRCGGQQVVLGPGKGRENMQGYLRWLCSAHPGLPSRGFFIVKIYVWQKKIP